MARARPPAGGLGWLFTTRIRRSSACGFSGPLSYPPADFEIAAPAPVGEGAAPRSHFRRFFQRSHAVRLTTIATPTAVIGTAGELMRSMRVE